MATLTLKNISKQYKNDDHATLRSIDLTVTDDDFLVLLGPSGCGKTTTLRIIAGLEQPDSGHVFLDGKDVTSLEPNQRNVNTVFQNYALFPHMNVADNIGYGLKLKKTSKAEISRRVKEMLELVQLPGFERRKPSELSGGQRQRLAIARVLIRKAEIYVFDDSFSALDFSTDAKLRRALREKMPNITKIIVAQRVGTIIDANRIIVLDEGKVAGIGTHRELLENCTVYREIAQSQLSKEELA